ncbi:MAG TPA: ACP S-malonyltransferase [Spirochaetia bacterium]|nr:ACP S-malonyltransferase [Spirochaetia bacterium]
MKNCFLFPGQGSQYPGMARDLWEKVPSIKDLFAKASDASGADAEKLLFESSEDDLKATDKTQIAITVANLAASTALKESGIPLQGCAGFSLGEYAALCEAGVIRLQDVFPIVKTRGMLMEKASRSLDADLGAPGMAAVLGMPAEKVWALAESLADDGVFVANQNSPTQVVVAGTAEGLAKAEKAFKEAGARRFHRLAVSGPFHSPLMIEARRALDEALAGYVFSDPKVAVYSNVTGKAIASGKEARALCGEQIVSTVRWVSVEQSLIADGFDRFFEVGPGTVLTGLMKALQPQAICHPAGTIQGISKAVEGN